MKKFKTDMIALCVSTLLLSGCSLFGLDAQEPYDFDPSPGSNNQLNMSAWDFMRARSDVFSEFINAVRYCEVDSAEFNKPGRTIFALTNQAIVDKASTNSSTNQHPGGYWEMHKINNIKPDSWTAYSKEQVKQFVLNHICKYAVSYTEVIRDNSGVRTFYPTMATNGYGYVSFRMLSSTETSTGSEAIVLWINDFPSHYVKQAPSGQGQYLSPRSSNLQTNNGSYVHVMDQFLDFPKEDDLAEARVHNDN